MKNMITVDGRKIEVINGVVGEGVAFQRYRRITGYLVGTLDRFNDAKKAEVRDRVKHTCSCVPEQETVVV